MIFGHHLTPTKGVPQQVTRKVHVPRAVLPLGEADGEDGHLGLGLPGHGGAWFNRTCSCCCAINFDHISCHSLWSRRAMRTRGPWGQKQCDATLEQLELIFPIMSLVCNACH